MATFDLSVPGTLWVSAESTLYTFQNTDFVPFTESSASVKSFQFLGFSSVQSLSHVRLFDPMDCSTPDLPVHYPLWEFTQTHVY